MNTSAISGIKLTNFTSNNTSSAINLQNNNQIDKNNSNDSWNFSINKKKAVKFAGFTAAALAVAGIFYGLRKKPPVEAKALIKQANEFTKNFQEKFQNTINETIALYKNGGKDSNGNIIAKITEDTDFPSRKIMEEFTDGSKILSRRSIFIDGKLGSIEKLTENNKYDVIAINREGKISHCQEGVEIFDNGNFSIAKEACLDNNKPYMYTEGFHFIKNPSKGGEWSIEKQVGITGKDKPDSYIEKLTANGSGEYRAKTWKTLMGRFQLISKWSSLAEGSHKA